MNEISSITIISQGGVKRYSCGELHDTKEYEECPIVCIQDDSSEFPESIHSMYSVFILINGEDADRKFDKLSVIARIENCPVEIKYLPGLFKEMAVPCSKDGYFYWKEDIEEARK